MDNNKIIDTEFQEIQNHKYYSIEEISKKLNTTTTKINHLVFKLNKATDNNDFFESSEKISDDDFKKLQLACELINNGMNYDEVISYFKNNSDKNLLKKVVNGKEITKLDTQIIADNVTLEVKNQMNRIIDEMKNEISVDIINSFNKEAQKIAKASLQAMEKTKDEIVNNVAINMESINKKISILEKQNENYRSELERITNKETANLRRQLQQKEDEIKKKELELENEKNKSILSKLFKK